MKSLCTLLLLIGVGSFLAACDRSDNSAPAPATPTDVRLGFFPNLTHAQAVLGVTSGDFAAAVAPGKFTPQQFNAGPSLIEALFAHQIDIGFVGPGPAITAFTRSQGQGIRVISGAADNGVIIVARKDSGINTLADLAGKKIATPQHANTQDIAARHYLTAVLKQPDTNNVLPIPNADQAGMMARGDIDASWAPEPWGSILISTAGAKLVGEEKDLWPGKEFSLTVIVTTPEFLSAHPDVVEKILTVNHNWTTRLNAEAGKYVPQLEQGLLTLTGKKLAVGVAGDALARVKFTEEVSAETFQTNAQWSYDLGFSREKQDITGLIDLAILRKLQASGKN
jgi:NitT/TauT family transport system substrate-binding protein